MRTQTFRLRALFSALLFISVIVLLLTGVGLFVSPHDHAADWLSWSWMGMDQDVFSELHITFGLLFFISSLMHIIYNFKLLLSQLKKPIKGMPLLNETLVASLLALALMVGTLAGLPGPVHVIELGERVQESWAIGYPEAPIPNTESLTVEQLARLIETDAGSLLDRLEAFGINGIAKSSVIEDIAEEHDIAPYKIYTAIQ